MKNFSNLYIFGFASVLVIVVAALLSFVSEGLKPLQERNVEIEKKLDILRSVDMTAGIDEAENKPAFIEEMFAKNISESYVINANGDLLEGRDAFAIAKALKAEMQQPIETRGLPIFVANNPETGTKYIIPVLGKGLWGPIWGYVALNDDYTTLYGTVFAHSKETPGLGAEINTDWFMAAFKGKKIFDEEGNFTSITVVKSGADPNDPHGVDAISGGTITSKALEEMLRDCLNPYVNYFKKQMN
ncbi:MAG: NADH:ubiquinone reductase (Na(+)-transporting) subunit C [Bacteroidales bacterium]|nr:NADH:ubiquinone reductase (Na(+)-transporting) subunit C [Bacteroidales bacterium]MCF8389744.1 NADH:ubiquinone reductase (Na(+)-transporting) subunit C [Bacteroidales bacterium]